MMLKDWMSQNRWNINSFSKKLGISRLTLKNIMENKSDLTLRIALIIQKETNGQVKIEDLCPKAEYLSE
jgi:plasmid maintenance system antidote protein VapI